MLNVKCLLLYSVCFATGITYFVDPALGNDLNDENVTQILSQPENNNESSIDKASENNTATGNKSQMPDFEKEIYMTDVEKQKFKSGFRIPFDVTFKNECTDDLDFYLEDPLNQDMTSSLKITYDKKYIIVSVTETISEKLLQHISQCIFVLKVKLVQADTNCSHTVLIINFLNDEISQDARLVFEKSKYTIKTLVEYVGIIEQFSAKIENVYEDKIIKYSLLAANDGRLTSRLKLDTYTGILRNIVTLSPGEYTFKILVETNDKKYRNEAEVTLTVDHIAVCNNFETKFFYSLFVVHAPEGKLVNIIKPATPIENNCIYRISSQYPEGDYFDLDAMTGAFSLTKVVFKNSTIFRNNTSAKFTIEIIVDCGNKNLTTEKTGDENMDDYFNIEYNPRRMFVMVMIDDVAPVSFLPDLISIGYPKEYEFIAHNPPPFLISMQSVDHEKNDISIRYSIKENDCPFSVHPVTGNVYPLKYYSGDEDVIFTVVANASKHGKQIQEKEIQITVKFLTSSQIVEVYFENVTLENVTQLLKNINSRMDCTLRGLSFAVLPATPALTNAILKPGSKHLMRALCYAIDNGKNIVVNGEVIVEKMKIFSNIRQMRVMNEIQFQAECTTGKYLLLILVMVLATTLLLAGIGMIFVFMGTKRTPFCLTRRNDDKTAITPLEDDMERPSRTRWINLNVHPRENNENVFDDGDYFNSTLTYGQAESFDRRSNALSAGVSTFKPTDTQNNQRNKMVYRDLEIQRPNSLPDNANNEQPAILPIISLPPPPNDRKRNRKSTAEN